MATALNKHIKHINDSIADWTRQNLAKLNTDKSKYIIYTRMHEDFATRFTIDNTYIDRQKAVKLLGLWISENPGCWEKNTREMLKRTYANISMLTKLKYAGVATKKLLHIYSLFVRSSAEFSSVVWHDSLTVSQKNAIERLQIVSLKVIIGKDYPRKDDGHFDYNEVLRKFNLTSLFSRREKRTLDFGKKCIKHPTMNTLFPLNTAIKNDPHCVRTRELYHVNPSRTSAYQNSAIPAIQRRLNQHFSYSPDLFTV